MIYVRNNCDDANDMWHTLSPHPIATNNLFLTILLRTILIIKGEKMCLCTNVWPIEDTRRYHH